MNIPQEILSWSLTRPLWQRDALRRLFTQGALTETDRTDLLRICKQERGISSADGTTVIPVPLDASHLAGGSTGTVTTLVCIDNVANVNALAPNQTLGFASNGVTVIYGDNGAGKSGYARILKRACRARGNGAIILPDIFSPGGADGITATIKYTDGGASLQYDWSPTATQPPSALSNVSVCDSNTATVYVEAETNIAFTPHGLDVFLKLVTACDQLRSSLNGEIGSLGAMRTFIDLAGENKVGDVMRRLEEEDAESELDSLSTLSEADTGRIATVTDLLRQIDSNSAGTRASELRRRRTRYLALDARLQALDQKLGVGAVASLAKVVEERNVAASAAKASRDLVFDPRANWAVGSKEWQVLWDSARTYSTKVAYVGMPFPNTEVGAQCVLCHQTLPEQVGRRLDGFEAFIKQDAQRKEQEAAAALALAAERLAATPVDSEDDATLLDELAVDAKALAEACRAHLSRASRIKIELLKLLEASGDWSSASSLELFPATELRVLCQSLEESAQALITAEDPTAAGALRRELSELKARERLKQLMPEVKAEQARLRKVAALKACLPDVNTAQITIKNADLTGKGVSAVLRDGFRSELSNLRLDHLAVSIDPTTSAKGVAYHQVRLTGAIDSKWRIQDVLSEGEYRCIALAGFLTELATQDPKSAVVFDDPVSSLDHVRREEVADRIALEGQRRQVIVFTHDIVFLFHLQEECERLGVDFDTLFLSREAGHLGVPKAGLPWAGMKLKDRIGWLRNKVQELAKASFPDDDARTLQLSAVWGRLRDAWECGVEEVLLNGAVTRFSLAVHTKQLRKLADITDDDLNAVDAGMTEASKWLPGHSQPKAVNTPLPPIAKLASAIEDLAKWRETIFARRK